MTVKPLEWTKDRTSEFAIGGLIEISECANGSWKVQHHPFNSPIRVLPDREAAVHYANEWWKTWLSEWIVEANP